LKRNLSIVGGTDQPLDFIAEVKRAIAVDEAQSRHLDQRTRAATARLEDMIVEAHMGFHPERAIQAAAAETIIPELVTALKIARDVLDPGAPQIQVLNAAIRRGTGE
jgi:hypothetical protein